VYEKKLAQVNHFVKMLNIFNDQLRIILTGNGDPLASLIMRPIILNWIPKQHQTIILFTNGLLMKKLLPSSSVFNHISEFRISVDAGSDNVYEQVRFPGKFNILQENLSWLAENKSKATQVRLMFCLSSTNAHDIMNFVNMCSKYGFRGEITRVENWFTFDNYEEHNVAGNPGHRLFSVVKNQLQEASKYSHIHITPILKPLL
jgi:molybdenum cofactor biosynthesis enzyme MoaA